MFNAVCHAFTRSRFVGSVGKHVDYEEGMSPPVSACLPATTSRESMVPDVLQGRRCHPASLNDGTLRCIVLSLGRDTSSKRHQCLPGLVRPQPEVGSQVMDNIVGYTLLVEQPEPYKLFFDCKWAQDIDTIVRGTRLEKPVDVLAIAWRSIANAHQMPWLATEMMRHLALGYLRENPPMATQVVEKLQTRLAHELGNGFTRRQKKTISEAVNNLADQVLDDAATANQATARGVRSEDIWSNFVKHPEIVLSIHGSQRLCYVGLYFAYEDFVRHCTSLTSGKDESEYQNDFKKQKKDMREFFGDQTTDFVADEYVKTTSLVRNALVHAGGRINNELSEKDNHGLAVIDNVLAITARDTSKLYDELKNRASALIKQAMTLSPIYQPSP